MAPIVSAIEINSPPDRVFAYATDPGRFAEWQVGVAAAAAQGPGPPRVGSRYVTTRRIGRSEQTSTSEITELDPPYRWSVRGIDGPVRAMAQVTVEPLDGGSRSRLTVKLDFEGHGIGKLLVPLVVRRQTRKVSPRSYANLKGILEKGG